ncbi:MAG: ribosome hibernation-promoting factor, HPF/YfiA family [Rhodothalassiaceae bacterium]
MQISVTGRHLDIGSAFKTHVEDRLHAITEKYFDRALDAAVTVTKEAHLYRIDCTLHANQGTILKARADGTEIYGTFDGVADKIEKQLRRYKRRLKSHHALSRREGVETLLAQAYVIAPSNEEQEDAVDEDGAASADEPIIIAETQTEIPRVSVGDAVMLMDLGEVTALMFRNVRNDELNMVYRRPDGNIGWVDPAQRK